MKINFNLKLSHKALILVAVPLAFELIFVGMLVLSLGRAQEAIRKEKHSVDVLAGANGMLRNIIDCSTVIFMYCTTGSDKIYERYKDLTDGIPRQVYELKLLLRESANRKVAVMRITNIGNRITTLLERSSEIMHDSAALKRFGQDKDKITGMVSDLTSDIRLFVKEQEAVERVDLHDEQRSLDMVYYCIGFGVLVNIAIAVSLAVYFNKGTSRRLLVLMDNTERLSMNQALHQRIGGGDEIAHLDHVFHNMAEALAEAARRKQELVSMVSHDLRTPLTSVQASLTLLSEGVLGSLPARAHKEITNAENNTSRLINLINDLLDIEKMEAGQLRIDCHDTEIVPIFERSAEAVKAFADKQNVNIKIVDTELTIYADGDRIIQIIVNLLSNSIKFSPAESTVTLEAVPSENNFVELRVIDQGRGIPANFVNNLFARFQQVDQIGDSK
ncbi:MAG: cell wall metabolism sensor histidine kinase WalK, partial [Candidatus Obscuribacterales bacterium]|nr:cell wall metabolism sensor histidine kinase WalK [Candidatus Obscuribacterales bacterium]